MACAKIGMVCTGFLSRTYGPMLHAPQAHLSRALPPVELQLLIYVATRFIIPLLFAPHPRGPERLRVHRRRATPFLRFTGTS